MVESINHLRQTGYTELSVTVGSGETTDGLIQLRRKPTGIGFIFLQPSAQELIMHRPKLRNPLCERFPNCSFTYIHPLPTATSMALQPFAREELRNAPYPHTGMEALLLMILCTDYSGPFLNASGNNQVSLTATTALPALSNTMDQCLRQQQTVSDHFQSNSNHYGASLPQPPFAVDREFVLMGLHIQPQQPPLTE
jgi:hypothetical protein